MKIEITTQIGCIFNCSYCPQSKLIRAYGTKDKMSIESFNLILDNLVGIDTIHFSGFCEPFLNMHTIDFIEECARREKKVVIYTNAICLDKDTIKRLKAVYDNISVLNELYIHMYNTKEMNINYIDMCNWARNIKLLVKNNIPFEFIVVGDYELTHQQNEIVKNSFRTVTRQKTISRAGNLNSIVFKEKKGSVECIGNRQYQNVVLPNGDVAICCMDYGLDCVIGNLKEQKYTDIINGDKFQNFLFKMGNGDALLCHKCFRGMCDKR